MVWSDCIMHVQRGSCACDSFVYVTWELCVYHMTALSVSHSVQRLCTWSLCLCHMRNLYVSHDSCLYHIQYGGCPRDGHVCVTWELVCITWQLCVYTHDIFVCFTWWSFPDDKQCPTCIDGNVNINLVQGHVLISTVVKILYLADNCFHLLTISLVALLKGNRTRSEIWMELHIYSNVRQQQCTQTYYCMCVCIPL